MPDAADFQRASGGNCESSFEAVAVFPFDPRRLGQSPTAGCDRVPPDREPGAQRKKFGSKRILLNDNQRRRLAVKGKILGRKRLEQITSIVTPDTILRWHRDLVARHWDYGGRRKNVGRPPVPQETVELVLKLARENPRWGYKRIQGALWNLGLVISDTSIANILKAHGVDPAPDRKRQSTWKSFLKSHWDVLAAVDFTTIEVWTRSDLITY